MKTYISVKTKEQLEAVKASGRADEIIVPLYPASKPENAKGLWIMLPDELRENKVSEIQRIINRLHAVKGFAVQNIDELGLLKEAGYKGDLIAGELLYSYNSEAVRSYRSFFPGMKFISPAELTDKELSKLEGAAGVSFIYKAYGHQKLMTTAQRLNGPFKDEKGEKFIAVYDSNLEYSEIYTGRPVSMLDKKETLSGRDILIEFTIEDAKDTKAVLETMAVPDYIRGHHFKGTD